ncbi:MAG: LysM peptidoglycan-binding domain-containing protein [Firmicutes bacterium]|nr:LysM peptidoglycan-binding domain-containing protein [Bacillota bacterium]
MRRNIGLFFAGLIAALFITIPLNNAEAATSYTVQKGDSLYLIGKAYGVSVEELQQANDITGTVIYVGQALTIPTADNNNIHTVVEGDTLYLIGVEYGVDYQEIIRLNNLNSTEIYPGQQLRLPSTDITSRGNATTTPTEPSTGDVSPEEFDLFARIISAEAQGEPYNAQVAVGAVVLNRVASADFPNTITDVIYEKSYGFYQFSPVENGFINTPATDSAINAAKDALSGNDPTNGAIYFFETAVTTNKFLLARPVATQIGAFTFSY